MYERFYPDSPGKSETVKVFRAQPKTKSNIVTGGVFRRLREKGMSLILANRERQRLLRLVNSFDTNVRRNALQHAQASGDRSPFISTTFSEELALKGATDIAKETGIEWEIVTIEGPYSGGIDFEAVFKELGGRNNPRRFKDASLQEFGIFDLFIPVTGTSKSGFRIINRITIKEVIHNGS